MKKVLIRLLVFFTCALSNLSVSNSFLGKEILKYRIDELIKKTDPDINIGIEIRSLPTGDIFYAQNNNRFFRPASLIKNLTALAVLLKLGPDYYFRTSIYKDHKNIYFKFSGDPLFKFSDLLAMFKSYKEQSGAVIKGDLIVDINRFKLPLLSGGWTFKSMYFYHAAPISTLMVDKNTVCFKIMPSSSPEQQAEILYPADQVSYPIVNTTTTNICTHDNKIERHHLDINTHIEVGGCLEFKGAPLKICLPIKEKDLLFYIEKNIIQALHRNGIILKGKVKFQSFNSEKMKKIVEHDSVSSLDLLKEGMKRSDNVIMECFFRTLLNQTDATLFKEEDAGEFIKKTLSNLLKVDFSRSEVSDGSGLSHFNILSPHQIADLLEKALQNKKIEGYFLETLSVAGKDGSLGQRLKNLPPEIEVIGKTGSLSNTRNISGYILHNHNPKLLFVIMMNGITETPEKYIQLQDQILELLSNSINT